MIGFLKLTWQKIKNMKLEMFYLYKCWFSLSKWHRRIKFTYWDISKRNLWQGQKADSDSTIDHDGCKIFGGNKKFEKLIVMDNVSGLADRLNDFANVLTVSRKSGYI